MKSKAIKFKKVYVETQAQHHLNQLLAKHHQATTREEVSLAMCLFSTLMVTLRGAALGAVSGGLGAGVMQYINDNYHIKASIQAGTYGGSALMFPLVLFKVCICMLYPELDAEVSPAVKFTISLALSALVGLTGQALFTPEDDCQMNAGQFAMAVTAGTTFIKATNCLFDKYRPK